MRVRFDSALRVEKLGGDHWRLTAPLIVSIFAADYPRELRRLLVEPLSVPEGFETDFASVPRLPLAYLLTGNTAHRAAVAHDFLSTIRAERSFADDVFAAGMRAERVPGWRRWLMYTAVRVGGGSRYAEHPGTWPVQPEGPSGA